MSVDQEHRLQLALASIDLYGSQKKIDAGLERGFDEVRTHMQSLSPLVRAELDHEVKELLAAGVGVAFRTEKHYPENLRVIPGAPPMLFLSGDMDLLHSPSVGMCGSRKVSPAGLKAARICGRRVATEGLAIVSGYAKGVDTETHLAALESGGKTVIVLAEGILRFRAKKVFTSAGFDLRSQALVVSQFPPRQGWNVGSAMARNAVIVGLGRALVVVEAGETGGTLDAGMKALKSGRPVIALEFSGDATPEGNEILFQNGALRASSTGRLAAVLEAIAQGPPKQSEQPHQMRLGLGHD